MMKVVGHLFDAILINLEAMDESCFGENIRYSFGFRGE